MQQSFTMAAAHAAILTASTERSEFLVVEEVMKILRAEIAAAGNQSEWARQKCISRPALNNALSGRRNLQPKVLRALGLEEITVYRRV
jgi:DNA-binding phage protein